MQRDILRLSGEFDLAYIEYPHDASFNEHLSTIYALCTGDIKLKSFEHLSSFIPIGPFTLVEQNATRVHLNEWWNDGHVEESLSVKRLGDLLLELSRRPVGVEIVSIVLD